MMSVRLCEDMNTKMSDKCDKNLCDSDGPDSSRTLGIIQEFRRLYEDKMRILESEGSGDCSLQAKLSLQHDWIRDLNEQNEMLVRAVEELEQEATERVIALEDKLRQSSKCACEVMNGYKDLSNAFQHVDALQEDVDTLVAFVKHSAVLKTWDLERLSLKTVPMSEISFETILKEFSLPKIDNACDKMQQELTLKDKNIKMLQDKLDDAVHCKQRMVAEMHKECNKCEDMRKSMLDIRDALTAEVADKHDVILTLKRDVQVLEEQCKKADQQTHFKDDIIKELRKEIKQLKSEVEEHAHDQLVQIEGENVQLKAAIKKATIQLEVLENSSELFNENNALKKQCEDILQKLAEAECEKNELYNMMQDLKMNSARKVAALETMLIEYRTRTSQNKGQQTMQMQQSSVGVLTECCSSTNTVEKSVGDDFTMKKCQFGCQTETLKKLNFNEQETWCDCADSNTSLKAEEIKLEEVVHELQSSVSKMIVSECQIKEDKARIADLESQLSQAWRTRDSEVQAARACREQEITNLKQVIDNLIRNLDNEKQRADNLQKAVDLYHDTVDSIKESENKFKEEVMCQKRTIQNLQDALLRTKQNLEELQQRGNIECVEHSCLVEKLIKIVTAAEKEIQIYAEQCDEFSIMVEKLRDENIKLEQNLFYNHQDLEMYEMRLAKYQMLYNQAETQCGCLKKQLDVLNNEKTEKDLFVQDLSDNLCNYKKQLSDLYTILNDEKSGKDDQSGQLAELQKQHGVVSGKLDSALRALEHEQQQNIRLSKTLKKNQCVTTTIRNETRLAHEKLQAAAIKIANDELKIQAFVKQIDDYKSAVNSLEHKQCVLTKQLEMAELKMNNRCDECDKFTEQIDVLKAQHNCELVNFNKTVKSLTDQIYNMELCCAEHCKQLQDNVIKMTELDRKESKLKQDLLDKETAYHTQVNQFLSEQQRLITVVNSLEHQIEHMNAQLIEKEHVLDMWKNTMCSQEKLREKQEEIIHLKNEINTLMQSQEMLKVDNDKMQMQMAHLRASVASNDDKNKIIIGELESCLNDLHNDKEFLVRKNEQLMGKMQSLQEMCNTKTESLMTMELELSEAKFTRDSLCNESKQVIDHVKCWLEEQRKINVELNQRIQHKNDVIGKLKQEQRNLNSKMKQSQGHMDTVGNKCNNTILPRTQQKQQYTMQVLHSPPPPQTHGWSLGSVDSAPCSLIDDSDWEADNNEDNNDQEDCPQVWIHRVESLTEELQRSNNYWKSKMCEQEYSVSRDK